MLLPNGVPISRLEPGHRLLIGLTEKIFLHLVRIHARTLLTSSTELIFSFGRTPAFSIYISLLGYLCAFVYLAVTGPKNKFH